MMKPKLTVGATVELVVKVQNNILPGVFKGGHSPLKTFKGTVLPSTEYDPLESIRLSSDDPEVDVRVIALTLIKSVNASTFNHVSTTPVSKPETQVITFVSKSSNKEYKLTISGNGDKQCSCPGFKFHGRCKHIEEYLKSEMK